MGADNLLAAGAVWVSIMLPSAAFGENPFDDSVVTAQAGAGQGSAFEARLMAPRGLDLPSPRAQWLDRTRSAGAHVHAVAARSVLPPRVALKRSA